MSPAAQVARALGGYMPLPLVLPGLFPQFGPSDISPAPACEGPNIVTYVSESAAEISDLIKASSDLVENGVEMVDQAGRVLGERVASTAACATAVHEFRRKRVRFVADAIGFVREAPLGIRLHLLFVHCIDWNVLQMHITRRFLRNSVLGNGHLFIN